MRHITQTVFEKLLKETKRFESDEHVRNWLIRVTINECKKLLRSPWRKTEDIAGYVRTLSFDNSKSSDLFLAVMELPKKYRLPIYLHYYEDCGGAADFNLCDGNPCVVLKDGTVLTLRSHGNINNGTVSMHTEQPIVFDEVDYILMADGTKLPMPEITE